MTQADKFKVDAAKIRAERLRLNYSMSEAATRAGMLDAAGKPCRQRWYDVESGRRGKSLPATTLYAVAKALGRKMEFFMVEAPPAGTVDESPADPK